MTNNQLLKKLSEDMKMRNFSHYTYDAYMGKTREMIRYFNKPMEKVTMEELRYFLYQHLLIERKLADRSINYYNSIVVLLILAAVSISMLTGENGILKNATDAKTLTERKSVVEQARTDVLGYQAENKGGDLDKIQLKTVLDKYFDEVPDLTDMSDTEIKEKQLATLAKYGTHTITVSEIYNGNIKTKEQKMISFTIRGYDSYGGYYETYELQCVEGMTWAEWANSSSKPIYTDGNYCGYFYGSLQELILSCNDGDSIDHWEGLSETILELERRNMVKGAEDLGCYQKQKRRWKLRVTQVLRLLIMVKSLYQCIF